MQSRCSYTAPTVHTTYMSLSLSSAAPTNWSTYNRQALSPPNVHFSLVLFARHCRKIRKSTDILWRVFHISTEPVAYTFVSVNRRNNEAQAHIARMDSNCLETEWTYQQLLSNSNVRSRFSRSGLDGEVCSRTSTLLKNFRRSSCLPESV